MLSLGKLNMGTVIMGNKKMPKAGVISIPVAGKGILPVSTPLLYSKQMSFTSTTGPSFLR